MMLSKNRGRKENRATTTWFPATLTRHAVPVAGDAQPLPHPLKTHAAIGLARNSMDSPAATMRCVPQPIGWTAPEPSHTTVRMNSADMGLGVAVGAGPVTAEALGDEVGGAIAAAGVLVARSLRPSGVASNPWGNAPARSQATDATTAIAMKSDTSGASPDFPLFCPLKVARYLRRPSVRARVHQVTMPDDGRLEIPGEQEVAILQRFTSDRPSLQTGLNHKGSEGRRNSTRHLLDWHCAVRSLNNEQRTCSIERRSLRELESVTKSNQRSEGPNPHGPS